MNRPDDDLRRKSLRQSTILVVDDDPEVLQVATRVLKEAGYHVVTAAAGKAALDLCDSIRVDLILSDVVMPGMNGIELARFMSGRFKPIPVILMSGYPRTSGIIRDFDHNLESFTLLNKPFLPPELERAVADSLRQARP